jgi:hypothetical protein
MFEINSNTIIYTPVKRVFDFISAPENDFQWQYGTLESVQLSEGMISLGSLFRSVGHVLGRRNVGTFEVTEYEPNSKYGFRSLTGPLDSHTSYTLEISSGGTKVSISTRLNFLDAVMHDKGGVEKKLKKQLKENLALLKGLLEIKHTDRIVMKAD